MKCEGLKVKNPTLRHEARVYEALKTYSSPHFLTFEDRGLVDDRFVFIVLKMKEQSRKDDLESWWYMIIEFMLGKLPWADMKPNQIDEIKHMKKQVRLKPNLKKFLKNTPEEYMTNIILYIDTLHYNSIPDYDHVAAHLEAAVKAVSAKLIEILFTTHNFLETNEIL
ncbi:hypothetical protein TELCIR_13858 [Teladorsagia circumcincta]|uniref:Protein kinase domain-containing protein n=1 Tax=Teladorsagia circumcincta TaxID=45464 RepID=A0A2G9U4A0_TELCI|nr:hypothetical protein TELCIR_13858 [Teladorsagia circumcincta]